MSMISVNDKINKLTVISERIFNKGSSYRKCTCECGGEKLIRETLLVDKKAKDCGCGYKKSHNPDTCKEDFLIDKGMNRRLRAINEHKKHVGKRYHGWVILSINEDPCDNNDKRTRYIRCKVRCVCGTIRENTINSIITGKSKSCGCEEYRNAHPINRSHRGDTIMRKGEARAVINEDDIAWMEGVKRMIAEKKRMREIMLKNNY